MSKRLIRNWLIISLLLVVTSTARLDFYSSTLQTSKLEQNHNKLVKILQGYTSAVNNVTSLLNRYLSDYDETKLSAPWPSDGDPLRTYVLIRRTTADLDKIIEAINKQNFLDPILEINDLRENGGLPDMDDLYGISRSLVRLQKMYHQLPKDLAEGNLSAGLQSSVHLSASDCLRLGKMAKEIGDDENRTYNAELWYQAGIDLHKDDIGEESAFQMEDVKLQLQMGLKDVKNKTVTSEKFSVEHLEFLKETMTEPLQVHADWDHLGLIYRRLCRGENLRAPSMDVNNFCHLSQGPHPYLKIRPLKVEVKNQDPYVVLLHQAIGDKEIETMKRVSIPMADRSTHILVDYSKGHSDERISTTSWLDDTFLPSLSKRIGVFLGMNSDQSKLDVEDYQVVNYGVGGYYNLHRDFFDYPVSDHFYNISGERIATLMFYLSDVEKGGATAFPYAGLAIQPQKGTAAFWWNLRSDCSGDYSTLHGACPVIYGSKWVSNKWFRMRPQMFRVPCGLQPNKVLKQL